MITREKNKITYIHFILSVLVILIHSINDNASKIQKIFSIDNGIGQFAVPLFFMISGFLFFRNVNVIQDVSIKIQKRIRTVLYPFLIWNIIYYFVHVIVKGGTQFSFIELFDVAFNYTYNPAFWFMFQLILLIAISPFLFYAIRSIKSYVIFFIIMVALIVFNIDIPFINEDAIMYYGFGAYMSKIYADNKLFLINKKNIIFTLFISIFFFLLNRILYTACGINMKLFSTFTLSVILVRLSTGIFIFYLVDLFFKYDKIPIFMNNSFFLYAIHYMIVKGLIMVMQDVNYKFIEPDMWNIVKNATFIISPIICICVSTLLSSLLRSKLPGLYSILTGDRV